MLSCQEITELVTDYVEGAMSTEERLRFETHIGLCRHCRAYLNQMRDTAKMLERLTEQPVPEPVMDELREKLREWKK